MKVGTMSMRKSSRSELRMDRVMLWHFGTITKCHFCKQPLLDIEELRQADGKIHMAGRQVPPIKTKLTVHHKDGDHSNNDPKNRKPCHRTCHRSFHMKQQHQKKEN